MTVAWALCGIALACAAMKGQESAATVVTVTARATPLAETSAAVTVLSREYIETSHADSAADLLRRAPFLQIAQSGGGGGMTTITIRGSKPNYVLVLIDGIPANDITTLLGGAVDFSTLPLDNIEQIEIVRGPLSSIYGSDAIGGVINFISRRGGRAPVLDVSGEFGSFRRRQVKVSTSGTWKALRYSGVGSYLASGEQVEKDAYSTASLAFNGSVNLGSTRILDFLVRYLDDHRSGFPAGSGGPEFALMRRPLDDHAGQLLMGVSLKGQVRPWWIYSIDTDRVSRREDNSTPAVLDRSPPTFRSLPSSTATTDFGNTHVGATSLFTMGSHVSLALGAGVRQESGNAAGFLAGVYPSAYSINRTSLLGSTELQYTSGRLTATAGLGLEKSTRFGEVTSPRLGVNWRVTENGLRFKTSWAKGFKLPSFYAVADPNVGNAALRPERSRAFDAGFEQTFGHTGFTTAATWFRTNFEDRVDFSSAIFKLVNRSAVLTQGVEFEMSYAIAARFRTSVDFSYTAWTLKNTSDPLRNIPHANGGLHASWQVSRRLSARADAQLISRRYDFQIPVPAQSSAGGYTDLSVSGDYDATPRMTLFARADNAMNSHYHEYVGFPNPGISARFGVIFHLLEPAKAGSRRPSTP